MSPRSLPSSSPPRSHVLAAALAGPAAANISTGNLQQDVRSAISSGSNVSVTLENGVATLSGYVENGSTANRVRAAALSHPDVDRVVDRLYRSHRTACQVVATGADERLEQWVGQSPPDRDDRVQARPSPRLRATECQRTSNHIVNSTGAGLARPVSRTS